MKIAIIGAGAAGYFAAIKIGEQLPDAQISIYESKSRSLAKVAISGGGRCNLTNSFEQVKDLSKVYPRGLNLVKRAFKLFNHRDAYEWFEGRGVELVTQEDQCVFPRSQDADEIVSMFTREADRLGVEVKHSHRVDEIKELEGGAGYEVTFLDPKLKSKIADIVIVTTGGSPKVEGLSFLRSLELDIEEPVPSLFSFNIPEGGLDELIGTVVENVIVSLRKSKLSASGPLLITHWGFSGPAILKLSSYGARLLAQWDYQARVAVNWVGESKVDAIHSELMRVIEENSAKLVGSIRPFDLPTRLWQTLLQRANISLERRFGELGSKGINRIVEVLFNDEYQISGQSRFREEFVTCGGVATSNVNITTLESRKYKNLYFAGEVLDVDAVTGGFNLQGAWSMGYAVAKAICDRHTSEEE